MGCDSPGHPPECLLLEFVVGGVNNQAFVTSSQWTVGGRGREFAGSPPLGMVNLLVQVICAQSP